MTNTIRIVGVHDVREGMYVADVDDESLTSDADVNEHYRADEQDWQHVVRARHQADISYLTLAYYNGELHRAVGAGNVWLLADEHGAPVEQEPDERELAQLA